MIKQHDVERLYKEAINNGFYEQYARYRPFFAGNAILSFYFSTVPKKCRNSYVAVSRELKKHAEYSRGEL